MCQVIENIPEGIIIYNQEKRDILMANQESRRLFKAYNVAGCDPSAPLGSDKSLTTYYDLTNSQMLRDKRDILQKRIFKSYSF